MQSIQESNIDVHDPKNIGCGGIILNEDISSILLIRGRSSKKWGLPKGRKNINEEFHECASREIMEETGLPISIESNYNRLRLKNRRNYYFVIRLQNENYKICPIDTKEIRDAKWFKMNNVDKEMDMNCDLKRLLDNWNYYSKKFKNSPLVTPMNTPVNSPIHSPKKIDIKII
jgi:mRNA-decapping enzyme subunit 2